MNSFNKKLFIGVLVVAFIILGLFIFNDYIYNDKQANDLDPSYNWETETAEEHNISFQYPESLNTDYINETDWPPQARVVDEQFSCTKAGSETERAGGTEIHIINNNVYCVTTVTEGTAGSIYRQYAYASDFNNETLIFTFSLRFPQCGNFNDDERQECEDEYNNFNLNDLVDSIVQSVSD